MKIKPVINSIAMLVILMLILPSGIARAEIINSKTYQYFAIHGKTSDDIDRELFNRGPSVGKKGRHPGATKIKFGGEIAYQEGNGRCSVADAKVTISTKLILPKWTNRKHADRRMALVWDTLAADIKRHEERHAEIARTHARKLEKALLAIPAMRDCKALTARAQVITDEKIQAHDKDQARFDRIEAVNFSRRLTRLLRYNAGRQ